MMVLPPYLQSWNNYIKFYWLKPVGRWNCALWLWGGISSTTAPCLNKWMTRITQGNSKVYCHTNIEGQVQPYKHITTLIFYYYMLYAKVFLQCFCETRISILNTTILKQNLICSHFCFIYISTVFCYKIIVILTIFFTIISMKQI